LAHPQLKFSALHYVPIGLGLCGCREIDRSPLANSMRIRVTGRCTDCWSSNGIKFHAYPCYRTVHWLLVKQWYWDLR